MSGLSVAPFCYAEWRHVLKIHSPVLKTKCLPWMAGLSVAPFCLAEWCHVLKIHGCIFNTSRPYLRLQERPEQVSVQECR